MGSFVFNANRRAIKAYQPQLLPCLHDNSLPSCFSEPANTEWTEVTTVPPPPGVVEIPLKYVVILGLANAELVQEFIQTHLSCLHRFIVVEPDSRIFSAAMELLDWTEMLSHPRILWFAGDAIAALEAQLREEIAAIGTWGARVFQCARQAESENEIFQSYRESIARITRLAHENSQVQIAKGKIIQENIVRNLPRIVSSMTLDHWQGQLAGVPAVIVGAGPSLNKNVHCLREAPEGTLIVAVDTALRPLLRQGIEPHFIVSCDPLTLNLRHFEGVNGLGEAVYAYLPETNAGILEQYPQHNRLLCLHDWQSKAIQYMYPDYARRARFQRGMNVGFCAFSLARQLECSPIILVGLDMAIAPGGRSHAEGTGNVSDIVVSDDGTQARFQGNVNTEAQPVIQVEGYYGQPVLTFTYFYQVLLLFEREMARTSVPVIDATEGGARKRGALPMPLQEALADLKPDGDLIGQLSRVCNASTPSIPEGYATQLNRLQQGLAVTILQLHTGLQRLEQWERKCREFPTPPDEDRRLMEFFLQRWNAILYSEELDTALDIALAPWRYMTRRAILPEPMAVSEQAAWWRARLRVWFPGLAQDLRRFAGIYTLSIQRLNNALTSGGPKQ